MPTSSVRLGAALGAGAGIAAAAFILVTCTDRPTAPSAAAPPPVFDVSNGPVVLVGAGNIARCNSQNDEKTALLLDAIAGIDGSGGTVFTTGDHIQVSGTLSDFQSCYGPSWGRHAGHTRPAPGDEEYATAGATGYFDYFGAAAGDRDKGYYSYDLGAWHIVVLNSSIGMTATSAQVQWLVADLAATAKPCVLAYWHYPRFSSYGTAARGAVKPLWDALYAARADVVVNGHYRLYERFAPQSPTGAADPARGITQFTVGTGGHALQTASAVRPNSEVRSSTNGVLKLTLDVGTYQWDFVPMAGQTFTDTGTRVCLGRPGGPPIPNQAPTADPGGPYQSEGTVSFDGSRSSDIDDDVPLTYEWDFGDGTTGVGATPTKSYGAAGTYTVSLTVVDALNARSAAATTTATIGNLPPAVSAGDDATVQLGSTFTLSATFTDPGGAGDGPWPWRIDWGDGTSTTATTNTYGGPISADRTFTTTGPHTVRVTVTDKDGGSAFDALIVTVPDPNGVVLVGAGDIASCFQDNDEATAKVLDGIPGTVILFGDNVYGQGTASEYANCYDPTWGRHKARTKPAPGNHDYGSGGAPGYFGYFGAAAGDPAKGYYSYMAGEWLVLSLNSASGSENRDHDSPQVEWLRNLLATTSAVCAVAYMHHPQFTSTEERSVGEWNVIDLWNALFEGGVELVLAGHDHMYERFAPMRPDGTPDAEFGIRQITNGVGGEWFYKWGTIHPHSVARNNTVFGVTKLTLRPGSYDWEFVPVAGQSYSDTGTGTCHGRPGGEPPPPPPPPQNQAPIARPGGPYTAEHTVSFNGSASSDPDGNLPLRYSWSFSDGTTSDIASPTKTFVANGSYSATLTVIDALDLASAPATVAVTIANVAPTVSAGPNAGIQLGASYDLSATFTDPGGSADSPWRVVVDWGDGAGATQDVATLGSPITGSHAYAAAGQYTVRVSATDKDGGAGFDELVVTVADPTTTQVLVGAANIARCDGQNDEKTALLLDQIAGTVFTAGDNIYGGGSVSDFDSCFGPSWGRHAARMRPAAGDEEYGTPGAAGYFAWFAGAGETGKGFYSYDLSGWHIVVLNSNIAMGATSEQVAWLVDDLGRTTQPCVLAIFHHPRFSSYGTSTRSEVKPLWDALYAAQADVIVNGHYRLYERFGLQNPTGGADAANGIRQFTVGTGGQGTNTAGTPRPNSEIRSPGGTYGVLKLTLEAASYRWDFVPIAGQAFTDTGGTACHGRPAG